jgi:3'-phosphoadenosine 5'-phosphosulfate sulfotransferase (PAPS reductase)/FAD synthetase
MYYSVSLSGGKSSAIAGELTINRYGKENVDFWFADTSWEDPDLYRFLSDLEARWDTKIIRYCDGRNPLQVADDKRVVPNSRVAPCSFTLKIEPYVRYLQGVPKPHTVCLGLGVNEAHRLDAPRKRYEGIPGVSVVFPLYWPEAPWPKDFNATIESWGIAVPKLYEQGFSHNNCGGRCVKQGKGGWLTLLKHYPDRYAEVEDWEDARNGRSILRSTIDGKLQAIPLSKLRQLSTQLAPQAEQEAQQNVDSQLDNYSCMCDE